MAALRAAAAAGRGGGGSGGGQVDSCAGLDEVDCTARSDCRADYCSLCQGQTFVDCARLGDPPSPCPGIACPLPCSQVATLAECDTRSDCHSVFVDPGTCDCATVGCCARFSFCANGNFAQCHDTVACTLATPYCESPAYVVSYTGDCYEGCVQPGECAP